MYLVLDVLVEEIHSVGEIGDQSLHLCIGVGLLERQEDTLLFDGTGLNTVIAHVGDDCLLDGRKVLGVHDHRWKNHCEDED